MEITSQNYEKEFDNQGSDTINISNTFRTKFFTEDNTLSLEPAIL